MMAAFLQIFKQWNASKNLQHCKLWTLPYFKLAVQNCEQNTIKNKNPIQDVAYAHVSNGLCTHKNITFITLHSYSKSFFKKEKVY